MISPIYTANMNEQQRAWFYAEYQQASKDEVVGVLLALFLGGLGAHKFYMGETGLGILYLVFFWTGIPALVAFIECFLMPGRVRTYNAMRAQGIMAGIMATGGQQQAPAYAVAAPNYAMAPQAQYPPPAMAPPGQYPQPAMARVCPSCRSTVQAGAGFCARCGTAA